MADLRTNARRLIPFGMVHKAYTEYPRSAAPGGDETGRRDPRIAIVQE